MYALTEHAPKVWNFSTQSAPLSPFTNMRLHNVIYYDIRKAFETVCLDLLRNNLLNFCVGGKAWCISEDSGLVSVNNTFSDLVLVTMGVPQSSIPVYNLHKWPPRPHFTTLSDSDNTKCSMESNTANECPLLQLFPTGVLHPSFRYTKPRSVVFASAPTSHLVSTTSLANLMTNQILPQGCRCCFSPRQILEQSHRCNPLESLPFTVLDWAHLSNFSHGSKKTALPISGSTALPNSLQMIPL